MDGFRPENVIINYKTKIIPRKNAAHRPAEHTYLKDCDSQQYPFNAKRKECVRCIWISRSSQPKYVSDMLVTAIA